jgi:hypothetical protein
MFHIHNIVSGAKTNEVKTLIFWISDWLDPRPFNSKRERDYCYFLGVPIDTKGITISPKKLCTIISRFENKWDYGAP